MSEELDKKEALAKLSEMCQNLSWLITNGGIEYDEAEKIAEGIESYAMQKRIPLLFSVTDIQEIFEDYREDYEDVSF